MKQIKKTIQKLIAFIGILILITSCGEDGGTTPTITLGDALSTTYNVAYTYGEQSSHIPKITYHGTNVDLSGIDFTVLEHSTPDIGTLDTSTGEYSINNVGYAKIGFAVKGQPQLSNTFMITINPKSITGDWFAIDAPPAEIGLTTASPHVVLNVVGLIGSDAISDASLFSVTVQKDGQPVTGNAISVDLTGNTKIVLQTTAATAGNYQLAIAGLSTTANLKKYSGLMTYPFEVKDNPKDIIQGEITYPVTTLINYGDPTKAIAHGNTPTSSSGNATTFTYKLSLSGGGSIPDKIGMDSATGTVYVTNGFLPTERPLLFNVTLTAPNHQDRVLSKAIMIIVEKKSISGLSVPTIAKIDVPATGSEDREVTLPDLPVSTDAYSTTDFTIGISKKDGSSMTGVSLDTSKLATEKKVILKVASTTPGEANGIYTLTVAAKDGNTKYHDKYSRDFTVGRPSFEGNPYALTQKNYGYSAFYIEKTEAVTVSDGTTPIGTLRHTWAVPAPFHVSGATSIGQTDGRILIPARLSVEKYQVKILFSNIEETVRPTVFPADIQIDPLDISSLVVTATNVLKTAANGDLLYIPVPLPYDDTLENNGFSFTLKKDGSDATVPASDILGAMAMTNITFQAKSSLVGKEGNYVITLTTTDKNYTGTKQITFQVSDKPLFKGITYPDTVRTYGDANADVAHGGSIASSDSSVSLPPSANIVYKLGSLAPTGVMINASSGTITYQSSLLPQATPYVFDVIVEDNRGIASKFAPTPFPVKLTVNKKSITGFTPSAGTINLIKGSGGEDLSITTALVGSDTFVANFAYQVTGAGVSVVNKQDNSAFTVTGTAVTGSSPVTIVVSAKPTSPYSGSKTYTVNVTLSPGFTGLSYSGLIYAYGDTGNLDVTRSAGLTATNASLPTTLTFAMATGSDSGVAIKTASTGELRITKNATKAAGGYNFAVTVSGTGVNSVTFPFSYTVTNAHAMGLTVGDKNSFIGRTTTNTVTGLVGDATLDVDFNVEVSKAGSPSTDIVATILSGNKIRIETKSTVTAGSVYTIKLVAKSASVRYSGTKEYTLTPADKQPISGKLLFGVGGTLKNGLPIERGENGILTMVMTNLEPDALQDPSKFTVTVADIGETTNPLTWNSDTGQVAVPAGARLGVHTISVKAEVKADNADYKGVASNNFFVYVMPRWVNPRDIAFDVHTDGRLIATCESTATPVLFYNCFAFSSNVNDQITFASSEERIIQSKNYSYTGVLGVIKDHTYVTIVETDIIFSITPNYEGSNQPIYRVSGVRGTGFTGFGNWLPGDQRIVTMTINEVNGGADSQATYTARDITATSDVRSPKPTYTFPIITLANDHSVILDMH